MLILKEYQQRALDILQAYFHRTQSLGDANTAFYQLTLETTGQGIPYNAIAELPGLPYVCLRIPTGGGKTLVASHSIGIATHDLIHSDHTLVLWLTPSNVIRDQTLRALSDPGHPYRQAVESRVGPVTVLDISQALYIQPATLNANTTIIVSTMQAFRVDDTEGRKVYESSGALMSHFANLPQEVRSGLETSNGEPKKSLANVLYMRRPVVIVDEAHNARTPLSFGTLARFHPACILEFTATPDTRENPSNIIYSASAAELKSEAMIKMPIRLKVHPQWKELLADAITQRNNLEAAARLEQRQTGEYLRPIMLLQAQARHRDRETLTVDVVRQTLMQDFNIPENQIARATGEVDELGDIILNQPDCPIRYIITVQALREGWDCPFAYVLCSVSETRTGTAVEQILGRILRMPKAARKSVESLNLAYAFSTSENFGEIANQLRDSLVQNGFERFETQTMVQGPDEYPVELPLFGTSLMNKLAEPVSIFLSTPLSAEDALLFSTDKVKFEDFNQTLVVSERLEPLEANLILALLSSNDVENGVREFINNLTLSRPSNLSTSPAERGVKLSVPRLVVRRGQQYDIFEESDFLDHAWKLSLCDTFLSESEYSGQRLQGAEIIYDVTERGMIKEEFIHELQQTMTLFATDQGWHIADLVLWLDRSFPHTDIPFSESNAFITRLIMRLLDERGFTLDQLVTDKYHLRDSMVNKIRSHRLEARQQAFNLFLLPECQTPLEVHPELCFTYPMINYPYNTIYRGRYSFKKHYYPQIGDLEERGEEYNCAVYLDSLPEVDIWVRNLERRPTHSFWLQTSTDRFYPDFVCLLKDGRYLVLEYKGEDRWSNDDSREKRIIGEVWEKKSAGKCIFVMPKGQDRNVIIQKIHNSP